MRLTRFDEQQTMTTLDKLAVSNEQIGTRPYDVLLVEDSADDRELFCAHCGKTQMDVELEINARAVSNSAEASNVLQTTAIRRGFYRRGATASGRHRTSTANSTLGNESRDACDNHDRRRRPRLNGSGLSSRGELFSSLNP